MKRIILTVLLVALLLFPVPARAQCPVDDWSVHQPPVAWAAWEHVIYAQGLFVAVASDGAQRVMTSPDGVNWTPHTVPQNSWRWLAYGNGMFVAVAYDGDQRILTSPDGVTWTPRTAPAQNGWHSVTFGNGRFVAVANNGSQRVMTSPDGINWTLAGASAASGWSTVGYGNGMFVALAWDGTTRAMSSPDGINWTSRSLPAGGWIGVTYGNGQFVAISWTGTHVATSPDGITWTARTPSHSINWNAVHYAGGYYVAVGSGGPPEGFRMMTSLDGIEWEPQHIPHDMTSLGPIAWGNDRLLVLGYDNYPHQVFVGECPNRCYVPDGRLGSRKWFMADSTYRFCDGEEWLPFSTDGSAGSCSVAGRMDWEDGEAAHAICDGSDRIVLRVPESTGCHVSAISHAGYVEDIDYVWPFEYDYTYTARLVDVTADGTKLAVVGGWNNILALYDITSPTTPTVLGRYFDSAGNRLSDARGLAIRGNNAYVAARNNIAAGTNSWISVFDISGSGDPSLLGQHYIGAGSRTLYDLALSEDGQHAYTVTYRYESAPSDPDDGAAWLHVIDVSNPASMSTVSRLELSTIGYYFPNEIKVAGNIIVISFSDANGGLVTVDVSNPAEPVMQDHIFDANVSGADAVGITTDARYAFVAGRFDNAFAAYDISDPLDITFVSRITSSSIGSDSHITLHGNVAVISSYGTGAVTVIDVSNPANMSVIQILSGAPLYQNPAHSVISGDYLYIADSFAVDGLGRITIADMGCDPTSVGVSLGPCTREATIDFEPAMPLYKYCDGSNWRPMTFDPCLSDPAPEIVCVDG